VDRTRHGDRTTWVWRERRPMASYLALVSIADYDVYRSTFRSITGRRVPTWSFVGPGLGTQRAARRLLPKVLGWEERHFGAYPMRSAGLVLHKLNIGYALETQDRPFFPGKPATSTVVHELAHQWYGDGNTLKDWGDIWLNEGFATYAEWWWSGTHGGPTPAEIFRDSYDSHGPKAGLWKPAPVGFTDPADLFGSQAYERGAMTLQVLREKIGTPAFRSVLRSWGHRRQGTTRQFVALVERRSGKRLDRLFHDWLYTEGKPAGY
jgi:aminopeptidase N